MKKMLVLLLIVGILMAACTFQATAESSDGENASFEGNEPSENSFGDPVPCGGEGGSGGGGGGQPG